MPELINADADYWSDVAREAARIADLGSLGSTSRGNLTSSGILGE
jgi:hypothetical protein